uniref:Trafficking protein particle complex subunit n=1 Tax=Rhabditophanes sp. KR3021 TaxID=114890 RepID=A0AC35TL69_9BILA
MVLCIAIFDSNNIPLYNQTADKELSRVAELSLFAYSSLDVLCEDKDRQNNASRSPDLYVGLLLEDNKIKSFGYLTNTGNKLILIFDCEAYKQYKEHDVRVFFSRLHIALCSSFFNPFYNFGEQIECKQMKKIASEILST